MLLATQYAGRQSPRYAHDVTYVPYSLTCRGAYSTNRLEIANPSAKHGPSLSLPDATNRATPGASGAAIRAIRIFVVFKRWRYGAGGRNHWRRQHYHQPRKRTWESLCHGCRTRKCVIDPDLDWIRLGLSWNCRLIPDSVIRLRLNRCTSYGSKPRHQAWCA